jgi:hypothetical protein
MVTSNGSSPLSRVIKSQTAPKATKSTYLTPLPRPQNDTSPQLQTALQKRRSNLDRSIIKRTPSQVSKCANLSKGLTQMPSL